MNNTFFTIKEVRLNNYCPECYSQEELWLTIKQKSTENDFYKAVTEDTIHSLFCKKCSTEIFPIRWSEEIEQVVVYHMRAAVPKPKSLKLKKIAWILILTLAVVLLGVIFLKVGFFE